MRCIYAWAAIGKKSGRVLRTLGGHYAIFTRKVSAEAECPTYGYVAQVRITVKGKRRG
jgi:hypothetical protein